MTAQLVRPTGKRRGHLLRCEREGTGLRPDIADRRGAHDLAAFAGEDPPVRCGAEGVDVLAQDRDKAAPLAAPGPALPAPSRP